MLHHLTTAGDPMGSERNEVELTILMPCLNESETIESCIRKAKEFIKAENIQGEILIADNGSTDGSQEIARRLGARVIDVTTKGYGSALLGGINAAHGEHIIMGDSDDTYDFRKLKPFLQKLREGYDLVMGNRFMGGIERNAMPLLHRYLGNPLLTRIGRLLFKSACGDFHCGLRGFRTDAILRLELKTTGMEFASEMVVKASLSRLRVTEVPTTLSPERPGRQSHLRTWGDGWRHLRFMLLYSPDWLFLYPGFFLMLVGLLIGSWIFTGPKEIGGITFDIHTLLVASLSIIVGFQSLGFAFVSKVFAITEGLLPGSPGFMKLFKYFKLEIGLIFGFIPMLLGGIGILSVVLMWSERSFGPLNVSETIRIVIPSVTFLTLGFQTILTSFLLSMLGMKRQ